MWLCDNFSFAEFQGSGIDCGQLRPSSRNTKFFNQKMIQRTQKLLIFNALFTKKTLKLVSLKVV